MVRKILFSILLVTVSSCSNIISSVRSTPIEDDPHTRSLGTKIDDNIIETKARVNLSETSKLFDQSHITVIAYNGVVLLVGQVPSQEIMQQAADALRPIVKIRSVHNELTAEPNTSIFARTKDSWITSDLNTRLAFAEGVTSSHVKVVTENSVIYLMGLVTESEANTVTDTATQISGVDRVVKIFEYIN